MDVATGGIELEVVARDLPLDGIPRQDHVAVEEFWIVERVARPMLKYLAVLAVVLILLVLVPGFSLWLPSRFGM